MEEIRSVQRTQHVVLGLPGEFACFAFHCAHDFLSGCVVAARLPQGARAQDYLSRTVLGPSAEESAKEIRLQDAHVLLDFGTHLGHTHRVRGFRCRLRRHTRQWRLQRRIRDPPYVNRQSRARSRSGSGGPESRRAQWTGGLRNTGFAARRRPRRLRNRADIR